MVKRLSYGTCNMPQKPRTKQKAQTVTEPNVKHLVTRQRCDEGYNRIRVLLTNFEFRYNRGKDCQILRMDWMYMK